MNIAPVRYIFLTSMLFTLGLQDAFAVLLWEDGFETTGPSAINGMAPSLGTGTRSVPAGHDSLTDGTFCTAGDYFYRTTTTGVDAGAGHAVAFSGFEGSNIWRAEDIDGALCAGKVSNPDAITWTGIDITGMANLIIGGHFAAADSVFVDDGPFETGDFIRLEYQIDGGGFLTALEFLPTKASNAPLEDAAFGADLSPVLTPFEIALGAGEVGASLDIRLTVSVNGGGEEIAFDLIQVGESGMLPVELQSFEID